jgi:hypothetical protein
MSATDDTTRSKAYAIRGVAEAAFLRTVRWRAPRCYVTLRDVSPPEPDSEWIFSRTAQTLYPALSSHQ